MKKLSLLALILPLLGCSHVDENNEVSSKQNNIMQEPPIIEDEKSKNVSSTKEDNRSYNLNDLNSQIINISQEEETAKPYVKKDSSLLDVIIIRQTPELRNGCEVTSLAMMLNYAGVQTNKMELYRLIKKDPDPLIKSPKGDFLHWGNPDHGFVGDMTGKQPGYAAFEQPMIDLINQKLPGRAVNLTKQPFEKILEHVSSGFPVVIWTTGDYRLPDRWEAWNHGKESIKTPLDLHVVLLVGYDEGHVYLNDPLSGKKQVKVNKDQFIASWNALENRAVSYK